MGIRQRGERETERERVGEGEREWRWREKMALVDLTLGLNQHLGIFGAVNQITINLHKTELVGQCIVSCMLNLNFHCSKFWHW